MPAMSVAKNVLRNSGSIVKAEVLHFLGLFWRTLWKTTAILGGLLFLKIFVGWLFDGRPLESPADAFVFLFLMGVYAFVLAVQVGLLAAGFRVCWNMAGAFILVPVVLIPVSVAGSFWLFGGLLGDSAAKVLTALVESGAEHEWLIGKIGPAARIGPPVLILILPLLAVDLVALLFDVGVIWSLFVFLLLVAVAFLIGFVPSALASLTVVIAAYAKRFAARHKERLANITASAGRGDGLQLGP